MTFRPFGDYLLVRLEEPRERGPILLPHGTRIRLGQVISIGLGRHSKRGNRIPNELTAGDRVAFFRENLEHRPGKEIQNVLTYLVADDVGLLREPDVLFVVPYDWDGALS